MLDSPNHHPDGETFLALGFFVCFEDIRIVSLTIQDASRLQLSLVSSMMKVEHPASARHSHWPTRESHSSFRLPLHVYWASPSDRRTHKLKGNLCQCPVPVWHNLTFMPTEKPAHTTHCPYLPIIVWKKVGEWRESAYANFSPCTLGEAIAYRGNPTFHTPTSDNLCCSK